MIIIDTSPLSRVAVDLGRIGAKGVDAIEPVMKRAAQNIKTNMQQAFSGSDHFRRIAAAVSYDRTGFLSSTLGYEIGPEVGRGSGSLAGIAVEGGANGGGGSVDVQPALDAEIPNLEKYLGEALGRLL